MSWEDEIKELRHREQLAMRMGGQDKVARQHEFGKLTVRERIAAICDPDSFHEIGTLAGVGKYDDAGNLTEFTPSNFFLPTVTVDLIFNFINKLRAGQSGELLFSIHLRQLFCLR